MGYKERQLVKIVKEICRENDIKCESFSGDYILQLNKDGNNALIYGYKFPNNDAAISNICDDKSALSDILKSNNIPHVEHEYFEGPKSPMTSEKGFWATLLERMEKNGKLVLKTNSGSGGNNVYKCETVKELEIAAFDILKSHRSMAVAPFIDIENEYRVIIEGGKARVIYSKQRPYVVGNGIATLEQLIVSKNFEDVEILPTLDLKSVPAAGEKVTVSWKHNLGQGSMPVMIKDTALIKKLARFALATASTLHLDFASIDIVKDKNGEYKILEINSGVMMEAFSKLNEDTYKIAKHIYSLAVADSLNIELKDDIKTIYEECSEEILKGINKNGRVKKI